MGSYCIDGKFDGDDQQYPCIYDENGNYAILTSNSVQQPNNGWTFNYTSNGTPISPSVTGTIAKILVPPNVILKAADKSNSTIFQLGGLYVKEYSSDTFSGYGEVIIPPSNSSIPAILWSIDPGRNWTNFVYACSQRIIPASDCQQFASATSDGWSSSFFYAGVPSIRTDTNRWIMYFILFIFALSLIVIVIMSAYLSYARNKRQKMLNDHADILAEMHS